MCFGTTTGTEARLKIMLIVQGLIFFFPESDIFFKKAKKTTRKLCKLMGSEKDISADVGLYAL